MPLLHGELATSNPKEWTLHTEPISSFCPWYKWRWGHMSGPRMLRQLEQWFFKFLPQEDGTRGQVGGVPRLQGYWKVPGSQETRRISRYLSQGRCSPSPLSGSQGMSMWPRLSQSNVPIKDWYLREQSMHPGHPSQCTRRLFLVSVVGLKICGSSRGFPGTTVPTVASSPDSS